MIQMQLKDEAQFYHRLDPSQTRLSDEVYYYLKSYSPQMGIEKFRHNKLQIICDGPFDVERAKRAIREAVNRDQQEFDIQIEDNRKKMRQDYIMGILLSIAGCLLTVFLNQMILSIISFVGTMAVRDAVTIHTKLNPDIIRLKKSLNYYCEMELEVIRPSDAGSKETGSDSSNS